MRQFFFHVAAIWTFGFVVNSTAELPAQYDARDFNLITSVKNQGHLGTCWAFTATSMLETGYIQAGLGTADTTDFSEWYMANYAHPQSNNDYTYNYQSGFGWGERMWMPIYYAQAQQSAVFVNDTDAPYPSLEIQDAQTDLSSYIPPYRAPVLDRGVVSAYGSQAIGSGSFNTDELQSLKTTIQQHGSAGLGITWDMEAIGVNSANQHVYRDADPEGAEGGHGIQLVGWDDQIETGGAPGAFIVKNSWDTTWGDDGYFYLSYDSYIGSSAAHLWLEVEDKPELTRIYSTMPELDGTDSVYPDAIDQEGAYSGAVAANVALDHSDSASDILTSVAFWGVEGTDMSMELYDGMEEDGSLSSLLYTESVSLEMSGFQVIDLSEQLDVSQIDDLWLVCQVTNAAVQYFKYSDPSALQGYYTLVGDQWVPASSTGTFSPTNFYMVPEPSTVGLLAGAGLLIAGYRRCFGRV